MAVGHYADGRASLVVGTHTHVPTADHQILAGGTAFQTDAGMCGDYDSVIGMDKQVATARFTGEAAPRLSVAVGEPTLCGLLVESNDEGHAVSVEPLRRGGRLSAATPARPSSGPGSIDPSQRHAQETLAQPVVNLL